MKIDHLILGIADLDKGTKQFESMTGVTPVFGGVHPTLGTQNALVSLGNDAYLEIIAPQHADKPLTGPFRGFENMQELTPVGWAIGHPLLEIMGQQLEAGGLQHTGIMSGSRETTDGSLLEWSFLFRVFKEVPSIDPFFISWEDMNLHPSRSTPAGCSIHSLSIANVKGSSLGFVGDIDSPTEWIDSNADAGTLTGFTLKCPSGLVNF